MLLTAEHARQLGPRTDVERVLDQIERAVKNAAIQGAKSVNVSALIPNWRDATNPTTAIVTLALQEAGYTVTANNGIKATYGGGEFTVSWG